MASNIIASIKSSPNLLTKVGAPKAKAFEILKVKFLPKYPSVVPGSSKVPQYKFLTKHLKATEYRVKVDDLATPAMFKAFPLRAKFAPPRASSMQCMYAGGL